MNSFLIGCLSDVLSEKCKEFRDDASCNKVKRFVKACPDVKPKRDRLFLRQN